MHADHHLPLSLRGKNCGKTFRTTQSVWGDAVYISVMMSPFILALSAVITKLTGWLAS